MSVCAWRASLQNMRGHTPGSWEFWGNMSAFNAFQNHRNALPDGTPKQRLKAPRFVRFMTDVEGKLYEDFLQAQSAKHCRSWGSGTDNEKSDISNVWNVSSRTCVQLCTSSLQFNTSFGQPVFRAFTQRVLFGRAIFSASFCRMFAVRLQLFLFPELDMCDHSRIGCSSSNCDPRITKTAL